MSGGNLDLTIPKLTFLATSVSDATWGSVVVTAKTDEPGDEAKASEIPTAGGQLWSNLQDDMFDASYDINQGWVTGSQATGDAVDTAVRTLDTLTVDGESVFIDLVVHATWDASPANFLEAPLSGLYRRHSAGTISVVNPETANFPSFGTFAFASIVVNGDAIELHVQGEAATAITWRFTVNKLRRIS